MNIHTNGSNGCRWLQLPMWISAVITHATHQVVIKIDMYGVICFPPLVVSECARVAILCTPALPALAAGLYPPSWDETLDFDMCTKNSSKQGQDNSNLGFLCSSLRPVLWTTYFGW